MFFDEKIIILAIECPPGMVYQQCGPLCPQTCDTDEDVECSNGCVEGCFCPSEKFTSYGFCLDFKDCQGIYCTSIISYVYLYA